MPTLIAFEREVVEVSESVGNGFRLVSSTSESGRGPAKLLYLLLETEGSLLATLSAAGLGALGFSARDQGTHAEFSLDGGTLRTVEPSGPKSIIDSSGILLGKAFYAESLQALRETNGVAGNVLLQSALFLAAQSLS